MRRPHSRRGAVEKYASAVSLSALPDLLDRGDDVLVGAATANVAAHQFAHIGVRGAAWLLHQRHGGHDLAGGAVAALIAVMLNEGRLHGMQIAGLAEAFDGCDFLAVERAGKGQAGIPAAAIDMHGASATLVMVAAFLGAGE